MPLVTVSLLAGRPPSWNQAILDGVHDAIVAAGFPSTDRFQRMLELGPEHLIFHPTHPDLPTARTQQFVLVEILLSSGRPDDLKDTLRRTIVQNLGRRPGISPTDVMIIIYETAMRNWSFAAGEPRRG
jgi:phenylpyruvate tautomerase PptA (4-oxalocrotonate tautomerase family)